MNYYMPVRVYDEPGCVRAHAGELAGLGTKALLVTGKHSAKACGAFGDVAGALEEKGVPFCLFDQVEENPSVETVGKAAAFGLQEGADFVIGIGGGSPMDAAKAVAFLMKRGEARVEDLYDKGLPAVALPVAAVPTTCGTGSEVTGVSVLTVHAEGTKMSIPHRIFPELALVDGAYLKAAPHSVIVSTSIDALAHMVESYESKKASDYSRSFALYGLSLWRKIRPVLAGEREATEEDFSLLMRASTFAGMAIAHTGTSIPHALSYTLTYAGHVPHGIACGVFLKPYLAFAEEEDRRTILSAAGFESLYAFGEFLGQVLPRVEVPEAVKEEAIGRVAQAKARMEGSRFPTPFTETSLRSLMSGSLLF